MLYKIGRVNNLFIRNCQGGDVSKLKFDSNPLPRDVVMPIVNTIVYVVPGKAITEEAKH